LEPWMGPRLRGGDDRGEARSVLDAARGRAILETEQPPPQERHPGARSEAEPAGTQTSFNTKTFAA
jgi:hypothetical protein